MLVRGEKQVSPSAVVGRYDMARNSRLAGERERAVDAWACAVLLTVCWLVRPPLGG
jgi:hypothetical protein